jgi:hypothetical protein
MIEVFKKLDPGFLVIHMGDPSTIKLRIQYIDIDKTRIRQQINKKQTIRLRAKIYILSLKIRVALKINEHNSAIGMLASPFDHGAPFIFPNAYRYRPNLFCSRLEAGSGM